MIRERFSGMLQILDDGEKALLAELDELDKRREKIEARIAFLEANLDELSEVDLALFKR